jgi:hypothetical protein
MIEVGTRVVKTVYWIRVGKDETFKRKGLKGNGREVERPNETDAELRKHRKQKGLETPVVYAVNDVH